MKERKRDGGKIVGKVDILPNLRVEVVVVVVGENPVAHR